MEKTVIQANPLIEARKKMNTTANRIFLLGLQDVKPHIKDGTFYDVEFHETLITTSELKEIFGNEFYGNITNLKKQLKKVGQSIVEISRPGKVFEVCTIYRKVRYDSQKGLTIFFNDELKPYVLELVNQAYTSYKLKVLFPLSSEYAWRILESLLEMQGYLRKGHKEVFLVLTLEELRFRLNIPEGLYEGRIDNFRKRVLELPIAEINEKTDYLVRYEVQRTGRKVTGFKFWLKLKDGVKIVRPKFIQKPAALSAPVTVEKVDPVPAAPKKIKKPVKIVSDSIEDNTRKKIVNPELKEAMLAENMPEVAINTWFKNYEEEDAIYSWQLAIEHADKGKLKGLARKKYIKHCMENNISASNREKEKYQKEAVEREKRLEKEKQRYLKADAEGFGNLMELVENRREEKRRESKFEKVNVMLDKNNEPEPKKKEIKEIFPEMVEVIVSDWKTNHKHFSGYIEAALKDYGYTPETFLEKYSYHFVDDEEEVKPTKKSKSKKSA